MKADLLGGLRVGPRVVAGNAYEWRVPDRYDRSRPVRVSTDRQDWGYRPAQHRTTDRGRTGPLVHAKLTSGLDPLNLAARPENSLVLVGDPLGPHVTKLLD
jgi:hypothetical protein